MGVSRAQGPAHWGTDLRDFLRMNSLKAGSESCEGLRSRSTLGMRSQGMIGPHVEAQWACPGRLPGKRRAPWLLAPTCPGACCPALICSCPPGPSLHFRGVKVPGKCLGSASSGASPAQKESWPPKWAGELSPQVQPHPVGWPALTLAITRDT